MLLVGREVEYVGESAVSYAGSWAVINCILDFLAVRKIPLKSRPYLTPLLSNENREEPPEDVEVASFLDQIREILSSDRAA